MAPRILDEPGTREECNSNDISCFEDLNSEELFNEIQKNLPNQVCPAHSLLILYIQDMNKTMKESVKAIGDKVDTLENKIDNLTKYISKEQGKDEEKDSNKTTTDRRKDVVLGAVLGFIFTIIAAVIASIFHLHF